MPETGVRGVREVSEGVLRFGLDPLLALLFLALALGGAWVLLVLLRKTAFGSKGRLLDDLTGPSSQKLASLQGLRGILAFSVVAHHACCWYYFSQSGVWGTGRSVVFDRLADFGVIQFFYLSGFLFWRKLMKRGRVAAGSFYLSRFIRIGPVYYVCVGAALGLGIVLGGFQLNVPVGGLLTSLLPWLLFSIGGRPEVEHVDILRITCGVTWTLGLEWLFYLSLPFLAWFARRAWRVAIYGLVFGGVFLISRHFRGSASDGTAVYGVSFVAAQYAKFMLIGFGGGVLVAATEGPLRKRVGGLGRWRNWIVLGCYVSYLVVPGIAGFGQVLLLAAFALLVHGADLFGSLVRPATRLLGAISYPVYLVHGIVFYAAMRLRGGMVAVGVGPYLAETVACLAVVLVLATVLHLVVERPTMGLSERIGRSEIISETATR